MMLPDLGQTRELPADVLTTIFPCVDLRGLGCVRLNPTDITATHTSFVRGEILLMSRIMATPEN